MIDQEYYKTDHPAKTKGPVEVKITNLLPGRYVVKAHRVGFESNDVYSAWHKLGSPSQLTKDQVATLRKMADDAPIVDAQVNISGNGLFDRAFEMRENDVWLVELVPLKS